MSSLKQRFTKCVLGLFLAFFLVPAMVLAAPFTNWSISLDGVNYLNVPSFLQVTGQGYIENTFDPNNENSFTFEEVAAFQAINPNGGPTIGLGAFPGWQLTGSFYGYGAGDVLAQAFSFTGGTLDLYASPVYKFSTQDGDFFGSEVGTKIATFEVISGGGFVNPNTTPVGSVNTQFISTFLLPGYFFDPDMNDLVNYPLVLAFSNLTASYQTSDGTTQLFKDALIAKGFIPADNVPSQFYVANSGEFTVGGVVPEPGTALLLGAGLIGLAAAGRRKVRKN